MADRIALAALAATSLGGLHDLQDLSLCIAHRGRCDASIALPWQLPVGLSELSALELSGMRIGSEQIDATPNVRVRSLLLSACRTARTTQRTLRIGHSFVQRFWQRLQRVRLAHVQFGASAEALLPLLRSVKDLDVGPGDFQTESHVALAPLGAIRCLF